MFRAMKEERLLNEFYFQEEQAKLEEQNHMKAEDREQARKEMMAAMQLKAQKSYQQTLKEEEFRQRMMEKFAKDDRIEQMNAQRRRIKMAEHRRETKRLLEEKREM